MKRRDFIFGVGSAVGTTLVGCHLGPLASGDREAVRGDLRALRVEHDLCLGCRLCEDACLEANTSDDRTDRSLITVYSFTGPYHVAWACLGCPDTPCIRACDYYADPFTHRKALHIDESSGAITLDRHWCAGCERCLEACESDGGNVLRWDDQAFIAGACHLCDGSPACVPACPIEAISVVSVDRTGEFEPRTIQATACAGIARVFDREVDPEQLRLDAMPLRALRVDNDRCIGCHACEYACDEANNPREHRGQQLAGPGDITRSLIRVHSYPGPYFVAWSCLGCPDLPCVESCQAEAFGQRQRAALYVSPESGAITLAPEFCTDCQKCVDACTDLGGDVLRWDPEHKVIGACTLCEGDPACVRECPVDAIELVEVDRTAPLEIRDPAEMARRATERLFGRRHQG